LQLLDVVDLAYVYFRFVFGFLLLHYMVLLLVEFAQVNGLVAWGVHQFRDICFLLWLFLGFLFLCNFSPSLDFLFSFKQSPLIFHTEVNDQAFSWNDLHVVKVPYREQGEVWVRKLYKSLSSW